MALRLVTAQEGPPGSTRTDQTSNVLGRGDDGERVRPRIDIEQFVGFLLLRGDGTQRDDGTVRTYASLWQRWLDWAHEHDADPDRPDPVQVRGWSHTLAPSAQSREHGRTTMRLGCLALDVDDVSDAVFIPRVQRKLPDRSLSRAATVTLRDHAHTAGRDGLACLVALFTAARRSEVATLRWNMIDWDADTITLIRPKVLDIHRLPLHAELRQALERRRPMFEELEPFVFAGRNGGHVAYGTINNWVSAVADAAGIGHVTPHQLRHTSIRRIYGDSGGDIRLAQEWAGHAKVETTAGYISVKWSALARAVARGLDFDRPDRLQRELTAIEDDTIEDLAAA